MATLYIRDGGLFSKDPEDQKVVKFDWDDENLSAGVTISSNTFTITQLKGASTTPLTKDNESIVDSSRNTQLRLIGGTLGAIYKVESQITTSESPSQVKNRHFKLKIEDK